MLEGVWQGEQISDLGEQIQRHAKIPGREYVPVARRFDPVKFDARAYARLAKTAGMTYIVITAKHHDGFAMWDSKYTDFDIVDASPYGKDIIRMLTDACREEGLRFGVYYSNPDWHHNSHTMDDTEFSVNERFDEEYMTFSCNQLRELLTGYGPMTQVFFDMGKPTLEQSARWARTVRSSQPDCLVSGRVMNRQGDFLTMTDNGEPATPIATPWEVPCTFSAKPKHTWGYKNWVQRPPLEEEVKKRIRQLGRVASRGGNYLLNIGPLPDGTILPYHVEALQKIGAWVETNREAVLGTRPTPFTHMPWGEATWREGKLYLQVIAWPADGSLKVPNLLSRVTRVYPLASPSEACPFEQTEEVLTITVPPAEPDPNLAVLVAEFEGELRTQVPFARPTEDDRIVLDDRVLRRHSFYPGMTYRSMARDTRMVWDFAVSQAGPYAVELTYRSLPRRRRDPPPTRPVPVVLTLAGKQHHVLLPASPDWTTVHLGDMELPKGGRASLTLTTDLEQLTSGSDEVNYGLARIPLVVQSVELRRR